MQNGDSPLLSTATTAEPAPAPQPPSAGPIPAATPSLSSSLDAIGRSTATLVIVIYAFGFVILGFHDAKYGVAQFSPFRARIVLVGFVFVMLVSLAAAAQHYGLAYLHFVEPIMKDAEPKRRAYREIVLPAAFIYTAGLMSTLLGFFLFHANPVQTDNVHIPLWQTIASTASYILGLYVFILVGKTYLQKPKLATFLALVALAIVIAGIFLPSSRPLSPATYLTLILFLVGWQTTWVKRENNPIRYFLDYRNWYFVLLVLWLYISNVFAALPPRWGGGQPIPVQILQNTPAPWLGSNPADVLLLDETDQGLYVLLSPKGKAYFVPRTNVASMFFGTKDELSKKP
jgi:hypothetical protein